MYLIYTLHWYLKSNNMLAKIFFKCMCIYLCVWVCLCVCLCVCVFVCVLQGLQKPTILVHKNHILFQICFVITYNLLV